MSLTNDAWWKEVWSWSKVKDVVNTLPGRLGFDVSKELKFFKLRLNLDTGDVYDEILGRFLTEREKYGLYYILYVYSHAEREINELGELITLSQICPAIHCPMFKENLRAFEVIFGYNPEYLYQSAEVIGYEKIDLADAAVKIYVLPRVPIFVGIWLGEEGLPPSSIILFDKSVTNYVDCEAASILAGVLLSRLIIALSKKLNVSTTRVKYSYRYQCAE
ncbi:MAG: DUF3786 domain-containing protein [Ignisphaera sp.]|uniref:DUF3786 domain-containing protein n=1 Tax=Ignisphaera aggregans TaxID=334771 RepID=A0A7C4NNQ0_9CREN